MAIIVKNHTFTAGAPILSAEHNTNFDTIYDDHNGNITNTNIAAAAAIADTKLAQITTASKVSGAAITLLTSVPSAAGILPGANGGVPSGCILLWSGAVSAIPTGYVICDGTNSTPDLTGLFVVHADADAAGTYNVGDSAGSATHKHTIALNDVMDSGSVTTKYVASADTSTTDDTSTVSNLPPYYALAYIMKT